MEESKVSHGFTQGEWEFKDNGVGGMCSNQPRYSVNAEFDGGNFPIVSMRDVDDEAVANAHLISAAPEMYEILKELDGYFDSMFGEYSYCESLHDQIIGLLAKARGE